MSLTDAIQTGDSSTPRRLLPTPTAEDGERGHHGAGTDRLGAATFEREVRLLPTPQAADGDGGRQEKTAMAAGGVRPSGQKATLPLPTAVSMREDIAERPFAALVEPGEQVRLFEPDAADGALLPTPVANPDNPGAGGELRAALVHGEGRRNETGIDTLGRPNRGRTSGLLPTPTTQDAENTAGPSQHERNSDPLNVAAAKLLPTPETANRKSRRAMTSSTENGRRAGGGNSSPPGLEQIAEIREGRWPRDLPPYEELPPSTREIIDSLHRPEVNWGVYEAAVRRWESVIDRDAPAPTDEKGRLDPPFVEWMLGYDEGWFDVDGVSRTAKLRCLGNSVQVQVAERVGTWARDVILSGLLSEDP